MSNLIGIGGLGQVFQDKYMPDSQPSVTFATSRPLAPSTMAWPATQPTAYAFTRPLTVSYATAEDTTGVGPSTQEEAEEEPVEEPPPEYGPPEKDTTKTMWIVGGILGAVVVGGVVIWMVARKKKAAG